MSDTTMSPIETGRFSPENGLERELVAAATARQLTEPFARLLISSIVYVLGEAEESAAGETSGYKTVELRLFGVDIHGAHMIPVFTSEQRVGEFIRTDQPCVGLLGRDLLDMIGPAAGIVLNPSSAYGMELGPEAIAGIARGFHQA